MRYLRARTLAVLTLGFLTFVAGACGMDDAFAPGGVDSGAVPAPMATTTPPGIDPSDADAPDSFVPPVDAGPDANGPPSDPPIGVPDTFDASELDTERDIDTTDDTRRHAIAPLIYGLNSFDVVSIPAEVLASITFVRRGDDRVNTYDWETNSPRIRRSKATSPSAARTSSTTSPRPTARSPRRSISTWSRRHARPASAR